MLPYTVQNDRTNANAVDTNAATSTLILWLLNAWLVNKFLLVVVVVVAAVVVEQYRTLISPSYTLCDGEQYIISTAEVALSLKSSIRPSLPVQQHSKTNRHIIFPFGMSLWDVLYSVYKLVLYAKGSRRIVSTISINSSIDPLSRSDSSSYHPLQCKLLSAGC